MCVYFFRNFIDKWPIHKKLVTMRMLKKKLCISSHIFDDNCSAKKPHMCHSRVVSLRVWFSNFQSCWSLFLGRRWLWGGCGLPGNPPMWIQQLRAQRSNWGILLFVLVLLVDTVVMLWMYSTFLQHCNSNDNSPCWYQIFSVLVTLKTYFIHILDPYIKSASRLWIVALLKYPAKVEPHGWPGTAAMRNSHVDSRQSAFL